VENGQPVLDRDLTANRFATREDGLALIEEAEEARVP
jgi:hypothetical protein